MSRTDWRVTARHGKAAAALLAAGIYFLIGLELVQVVTDAPATANVFVFGILAGLAYLVVAALLVLVDRAWVWALGALLQAVVLAVYLANAPLRDPPIEAWGIGVSVLEAIVLLTLIYLLITRRREAQPSG